MAAAASDLALPAVEVDAEWVSAEAIAALRACLQKVDAGQPMEPESEAIDPALWPSWAASERWDAYDLRRFLIARQGDVQKAARMLTRHVQWRVESCPWFPESKPPLTPLAKPLATGKVYRHGWDKVGRPVVYVHGSRHIVSDTSPEESEALVTFAIEDAVSAAVSAEAAAAGGAAGEAYPPGQFVGVVDMAELGWSNMDTGIMSVIFNTLSRNYPERLGRLLILNEGWAFWVLWKVIEGLLDARVRSKIEFLGTEHTERLLELIPKEQLLEAYGGSSTFAFDFETWRAQYEAGQDSAQVNSSFTAPVQCPPKQA
ncbi:unnamed protein product [Symbiodinium sp. KB8]|nr:unnamed protein product [Symbiodinium sp. KB8]